jgi:5-methylcytosine-specific restriction endonuclease McrA
MAPPEGDYDILHDAEKLRRFYWELEFTTDEIAQIEDCCSATVSKYLDKHNIETRRKGARCREDHPKWVERDTKRYYGSWDTTRESALERDNYRCQSCGATAEEHKETYSNGLDVHHHRKISSFEDAENANSLDNLLTLCRVCHKKYERGVYGPVAGIRW